MKKYIKNKNFLPNSLKHNKEKNIYIKYFILIVTIINLFLIPLNMEIIYDEKNKEEVIPVYEEIKEEVYYSEIKEAIEILYEDFIQGNITNNKGQIITDRLEIIYKLEEEEKIIIKSIRKEENLGYVLEVELWLGK